MHDRPDAEFWKRKTVEELAAEQGITRPQSLDDLIGAAADLWASDEEFERFVASIDRHRREATPA
jgi:hypothetical protein